MDKRIEQIVNLKPQYKALATLGIIGVVCVAYWQFYYSDLSNDLTKAVRVIKDLEAEKASYDKRKKEYLAYREELNRLQEEQRELLKALPKKAEIPSFIAAIQEQAELSGLEVVNLTIGGEQPTDVYVRIPINMETRGTYHQTAKFFKNVAEMQRIVNVQDLTLAPERGGTDVMDLGTVMKVRARFTAATFRFLDTAR